MIRITTTSGTVYELDTDLQRVQRLPAAGASVLRHDGTEHRYHAIINGPTSAMEYSAEAARLSAEVHRLEVRVRELEFDNARLRDLQMMSRVFKL